MSVLKCDKMWLFERNLPSKHSSLSYIIRRFGFQTKILKEIHNNYSELQEYYILELSIRKAADTDTIAIIFYFLLSKRRDKFLGVSQISANATIEFVNRCYFKDMNFYGHEFFRAVPHRCFRVTCISHNENFKFSENYNKEIA